MPALQPARSRSRPVVVVMPPEIDIANSALLGERLALALASGTPSVIADLTATSFCDCAGFRMLADTYLEAITRDVELRLVLPAGLMRRTLALMEMDRWLPIWPDLAAADPPGGG